MKKLLLALALVVSMSTYSSADRLDLTTETIGEINGAFFIFGQEQPAGTGVIDSFLRIQDTGTEEGYNTSAAPNKTLPLDVKPGTSALRFSSLEVIDGQYHFLLDIAESSNGTDSLLSLDGLKFYSTNVPDQNGDTVDGTLLWDMGENYVLLDAKRATPGSGVSDMFLRIPTTLLEPAAGEDFLILWSQFGVNAASDGSFEEWAVRSTQPVPEPGTILLLGAGFAGLALYRRRQSHK